MNKVGEKTVFKKIKKGDVLAAFFALALCAVLLVTVPKNGSGDSVYITYGNVTERYSLYEDRTVEIENNGIKLKVTVKNGEVWVSESDCYSRVCINTGKIKSGSIVCAPAGTVIRVGGDGTDVIAG